MNTISADEAKRKATEFNQKEIAACVEHILELIFDRITLAANAGYSTILFKHNFVGIMEHNESSIYSIIRQKLLDQNYSITVLEKQYAGLSSRGSNLEDICWDISWN